MHAFFHTEYKTTCRSRPDDIFGVWTNDVTGCST